VQKNGTGPFCLARMIGGISFFIFHRRRRRRTICFAARRAPAKTGDCRSSWLTAACRKDDDGDDRVVTMRFCPCFIHAKTRVPRIQFFTETFRMSFVTMQSQTHPRTNRRERRLPLKSLCDKNVFSCNIIALRISFGQLQMSQRDSKTCNESALEDVL